MRSKARRDTVGEDRLSGAAGRLLPLLEFAL
jgi:hypothetical protein